MRIVLADDHRLVLEALDNYFKQIQPDIQIIAETDFDGAFEAVKASDWVDLVVLDINMPGMDGLGGLEKMREAFPGLPVVLISGETTIETVNRAIELGAAGFIPKDLGGSAAIKALELILSGEVYVPAKLMASSSIKKSEDQAAPAQEGAALASLTPREREVMGLLIEGKSNKEIARDLGLKDITAAFHLKGVFRKLEVSNRTEAVITAIRLGWQV